ncbi:MAG TPA: two-component regulator propeller domain-containing protein, partial [Candidatus Acidoferrum sp.]|nr:two-component regulator propeller domain-containing protein [Candidatus Acidoferrum sp.]
MKFACLSVRLPMVLFRPFGTTGQRLASVLLLCGLLLCFSRPARALNDDKSIAQYVHKIWDSNNGLPENDVRAILQTKDGYIWLGTEEGLIRFDGVHFTVFDHRNTPVLPDNLISALAETPDGSLWIGTSSAFLRYKDGKFLDAAKQYGLNNRGVASLWAAPDGTLWILTGGQLLYWKNEKFVQSG